MLENYSITPPFFEFGPKAYLYGKDLLKVAEYADRISLKYQVPVIITPQYVDIPMLSQGTPHLRVFAQHMDPIQPGRGIGAVLPEALKSAGAEGVLLNHAERPLPFETIEQTIRRAEEVGLATLVCAGNLEEIELIAKMNPDILLAESPDLIGTGKREENDRENIHAINQLVWEINPKIRVMHSAGISCGADVFNIIASGAQATGSTSGIIKAADPLAMFDEMLFNIRKAWDEVHAPH
ncbi:MAG: triose-phosphate isomerase [Anaerolineales bacterium]